MTEGSELKYRWDKEFSPLHDIQTSSGAHSASYPIGTGDYFLGGKAARV
jgi:hypothetical protein